MLTLDYIKTIWDYNYWGHHKLLDCLETVSSEDFVKPVPYSIGSLHQQIVHVMWAEALWMSRIRAEARINWTTETFPSLAAIRENWAIVEADWRKFVANLKEEDLARIVESHSISKGQSYQDKLPQILVHVVNHGTDHRSQMLRIIHDFGGKTFEQDMIYYFREKSGKE